MKKICVYGSINSDMILKIDGFPEIGQSISGEEYSIQPGGKGANQAAAVAKLGANVSLISMVGFDELGMQLIEKMRRVGVGVRHIGRYPMKTGINLIAIDPSGKKSMLFFTESNSKLTVDHLVKCYAAIDFAEILMLQLSVPIDGITCAAKRMHEKNGIVILDPSPAKQISDELCSYIDYITPNEKELEVLTGIENAGYNDELRYKAGLQLIDRGIGCVINKVGDQGAYIIQASGMQHVPAYPVKDIGNTGVGSAFNGGFAVSLARDAPLQTAVAFANAAGALLVSRGGSQSSMADYDDCNALVNGRYVFEKE